MLRLSASLAVALLAPALHAVELQKNDPLRQTLLELAHKNPELALNNGDSLVVKRAWASAGYAMICALTIDAHGRYRQTGDQYDVYNLYYRGNAGKWQLAAHIDSLSRTPATADCRPANSAPLDDASIARLIARAATPATIAPRPVDCATEHASANALPGFHPPIGGTIAGTGKALLHSAPDSACSNGKHLIAGDAITIYSATNGWAQVFYLNHRTGKDTLAWIDERRIRYRESR